MIGRLKEELDEVKAELNGVREELIRASEHNITKT